MICLKKTVVMLNYNFQISISTFNFRVSLTKWRSKLNREKQMLTKCFTDVFIHNLLHLNINI